MTNPFTKTTTIIVVAVAAISIAIAGTLTAIGDDLGHKQSAGVDAYSSSAIGHKALVRLLEQLDVPVVVSRSDSAAKARPGLLVIAEPTVTDDAARARLTALVGSTPHVLVVLPKWYGQTERGKAWIDDADFIPVDEIQPVLDAIGATDTTIVRAPGAVAWAIDPGGAEPAIREPQLLRSEKLWPTVSDRVGNELVGNTGNVVVLADPDVLNNYGLRDARNARFTVELIDRLRAGGPVVIDETLHGYAQQPSLLRTLFRFPLVLATLQVLVCAVLVIWAAMVRFGPRRASAPPIAPGKDFLIRNTAALLQYGGHHAHALQRYLAFTTLAVRHALHAPALTSTAMTNWLERVRATRGGTISLIELERSVATADSPARVLAVADEVFRWRREMTHGIDSGT